MLFVKRFFASHLKTSKMPHRFQSNKRPVAPLGSRVLLDPDKVFDHNMWDHMQWSQEEEETAKEKAAENSLIRVQPELQAKYEREASRYWNEFYKIHKNHFFRDRKWLFVEFPEILPEGKSDLCRKATTENLRCTGLLEDNHLCEDDSAAKVSSVLSACYDNSAADEQIVKNTGKQFPGGDSSYRILEVGCGAGNSVFPILEVIRHHPGVFLYCCDFASEAVELIKDPRSCKQAGQIIETWRNDSFSGLWKIRRFSASFQKRPLLVGELLRKRRRHQSLFLHKR
ncbi:Hypothetical predicted protein [Podarcis lilfordi]|uniref:Methyltransferase like 8 n=1 Tax=Podarcis lilfordi TaxID=74358 RepID=A0AA35NVM2_9SAUR|nr:Hypothetical predicted protein [Podarcis lilfordi]